MSVNAQGQVFLNAIKLSALRVHCDCMLSPLVMRSAKKKKLSVSKQVLCFKSHLAVQVTLFFYTSVRGTDDRSFSGAAFQRSLKQKRIQKSSLILVPNTPEYLRAARAEDAQHRVCRRHSLVINEESCLVTLFSLSLSTAIAASQPLLVAGTEVFSAFFICP